MLPSGITITGMIKDQAFTAVCKTSTGTMLPRLRLNSHANSTDEATALSAYKPIGR